MPSERAIPSHRPKHRYVLFQVLSSTRLSRNEFVELLRRAGAKDVWLTRFDGRHGVLRCIRGGEKRAIELLTVTLRTQGVEVETLSTSGTIASLERDHPKLDLAGGRT